jgi:hypothetical protein
MALDGFRSGAQGRVHQIHGRWRIARRRPLTA